MKNSLKHLPFSELNSIKDLAIVVLGAGGSPEDWIKGISDILKDEKIVIGAKPVFKESAIIDGNILGKDGRTDLVLIFDPKNKVEVGKLAMWRLKFGDVSWLEDFIPNYGKDYGIEPLTYEEESEQD